MTGEWLGRLSESLVILIDLMAMIVIAGASIFVFVRMVWMVVTREATSGHARRELWLMYARWLVAGLTFQLAADIIESSIAPSWEAIGQLGAIAVIRTFLNYFLERDVAEMSKRQEESRS